MYKYGVHLNMLMLLPGYASLVYIKRMNTKLNVFYTSVSFVRIMFHLILCS